MIIRDSFGFYDTGFADQCPAHCQISGAIPRLLLGVKSDSVVANPIVTIVENQFYFVTHGWFLMRWLSYNTGRGKSMAKERVFKDKGLAKAIKAAGGVRALARRPWDGSRPYERVLDVERVTGVPREEWRPDRRSRSACARDQGARRAAGGRAHD